MREWLFLEDGESWEALRLARLQRAPFSRPASIKCEAQWVLMWSSVSPLQGLRLRRDIALRGARGVSDVLGAAGQKLLHDALHERLVISRKALRDERSIGDGSRWQGPPEVCACSGLQRFCCSGD